MKAAAAHGVGQDVEGGLLSPSEKREDCTQARRKKKKRPRARLLLPVVPRVWGPPHSTQGIGMVCPDTDHAVARRKKYLDFGELHTAENDSGGTGHCPWTPTHAHTYRPVQRPRRSPPPAAAAAVPCRGQVQEEEKAPTPRQLSSWKNDEESAWPACPPTHPPHHSNKKPWHDNDWRCRSSWQPPPPRAAASRPSLCLPPCPEVSTSSSSACTPPPPQPLLLLLLLFPPNQRRRRRKWW